MLYQAEAQWLCGQYNKNIFTDQKIAYFKSENLSKPLEPKTLVRIGVMKKPDQVPHYTSKKELSGLIGRVSDHRCAAFL